MESKISSAAGAAPVALPLKAIPGSYGLPLVGLLQDRFQFFYTQGDVEFFKSRVKKLGSTVFRAHLVPTLLSLADSRGIALTDSKSFQVLFDNSKVEKANVFVGAYSPPPIFTGGLRPLAYLDTAEPRHRVLKEYMFEVFKARGRTFMKEFEASFNEYSPLLKKGEDVVPVLASLAFSWTCKSFISSEAGKRPPKYMDPKVGTSKMQKWVFVQYSKVIPLNATGLPPFLEDVLRILPLPYSLVRRDYEDICELFRQADDLLDMGEKQFSLTREEALHNIVFTAGVNMWLGFQKLLPTLVYYIASAGKDFQTRLGKEIRTAMEGNITVEGFMSSLQSMPLLEATVVEILRLAPPVRTQFARARFDFEIESRDARFQVRKGEMLCGVQDLACRDPAVFDEPDEFMPDRFLGPRKNDLLANVFWSNGRHTDKTSSENKQCAGKDLVFTVSMFFVALLLGKIQTLEIDPSSLFPRKVVLKSIIPV